MSSGLGARGDRPLRERRPPCGGQQPEPTGQPPHTPICDSSYVRRTALMHPGGPLGDEKRTGTPASGAVICLLPCSRCFTSAKGQGEAANKTNTPARPFQKFFPAAPASKASKQSCRTVDAWLHLLLLQLPPEVQRHARLATSELSEAVNESPTCPRRRDGKDLPMDEQ